MGKTKVQNEKPEILKFTKQQLLTSKRYIHQRDLLKVLLSDGVYSLKEVDEKINDYLKGQVK